jgi:glycosyltransferase involved in cell wall biosynthesis
VKQPAYILQFSIIIPTFNAAASLRQTLDSIAVQTFRDFEVLVLDARSSDNTLSIANEYLAQCNLRSFCEKDAGIYDAMNKGITLANGKWLYFLGSDDTLASHNVLEQIAVVADHNTDIVYGDSRWLPENKSEAGEWTYSRLLHQSINHQRIFYRKTLFEQHAPFNIAYRVAADYELNIRLFCNQDVRQKYIAITVANYHSGGFSANQIDELFWADWKKILLANFKGHLPSNKIYARLGWYCWYQLNKKNYSRAFHLFTIIFYHTHSFSFLKHSMSQLLKLGKSK